MTATTGFFYHFHVSELDGRSSEVYATIYSDTGGFVFEYAIGNGAVEQRKRFDNFGDAQRYLFAKRHSLGWEFKDRWRL